MKTIGPDARYPNRYFQSEYKIVTKCQWIFCFSTKLKSGVRRRSAHHVQFSCALWYVKYDECWNVRVAAAAAVAAGCRCLLLFSLLILATGLSAVATVVLVILVWMLMLLMGLCYIETKTHTFIDWLSSIERVSGL